MYNIGAAAERSQIHAFHEPANTDGHNGSNAVPGTGVRCTGRAAGHDEVTVHGAEHDLHAM